MTDRYEIEKDIPLPSPSTKYDFGRFEIGDSIFIGGPPAKLGQTAAHSWGTMNGRKFKTRTQNGGIRIWRAS